MLVFRKPDLTSAALCIRRPYKHAHHPHPSSPLPLLLLLLIISLIPFALLTRIVNSVSVAGTFLLSYRICIFSNPNFILYLIIILEYMIWFRITSAASLFRTGYRRLPMLH